MNYLAHLLLADNHPESVIGNLSGDFVKGRLESRFTPRIRRGIQLHRRVDTYTDQHAIISELKSLFSPPRRRYAGIILDVALDHFLSRHWTQFSVTEMRQFIDQVYGILTEHEALLPPALREVAPNMIQNDWLNRYRTLEGTGAVLDRISRRLSHRNPLPGSVAEIAAHYDRIERGFLALFPEVVRFAADTRQHLTSRT